MVYLYFLLTKINPCNYVTHCIWRYYLGTILIGLTLLYPQTALLSRLTPIVQRAWEIGYTQPCIKCWGKTPTHFVYFWSKKTLPYTHLEATSYIPQQGQSVHIWTTSLSTTGCYKNKYNIQFLWMVCTSRFATAILSRETKLALCTIRVKENRIKLFQLNQTDLAGMLGAARRSALSWYPRMSDILLPCRTEPRCLRHTTIHLKLQKQNIF